MGIIGGAMKILEIQPYEEMGKRERSWREYRGRVRGKKNTPEEIIYGVLTLR